MVLVGLMNAIHVKSEKTFVENNFLKAKQYYIIIKKVFQTYHSSIQQLQ